MQYHWQPMSRICGRVGDVVSKSSLEVDDASDLLWTAYLKILWDAVEPYCEQDMPPTPFLTFYCA